MDKKAKIATIFSIITVALVLVMMVFAAPKKCNNGADDDNDGLVDYPNDPGCSRAQDNTETGTAICDNGVDQTNDRDTLADFRLSGGDPGCISVSDTSEIDGDCDDLDDETNDADTLTDSTDPGCTSTSDTSEIDGQCDDLVDNDGDTHIDAAPFPADSKCNFNFSDSDESPRDFCSDTDGGIVSGTQGNVSGDDESVPFNLTDTCVDSVTLREYYCGDVFQDYAPLNTIINCGNATPQCVSGACV